MAEYQIVVTRRVPNPDYMAKYLEWQKTQRFGSSDPEPDPYSSWKTLEITVDEDTFAAIRRAALETL